MEHQTITPSEPFTRIDRQIELIRAFKAHYLRTGVWVFELPEDMQDVHWRKNFSLYSVYFLRKEARFVSQELKRPFVFATLQTSERGWEQVGAHWKRTAPKPVWRCWLQFPKTKAMDVLAAPLLFLDRQPKRTVGGTWNSNTRQYEGSRTVLGYNRRYDFNLIEEDKPVFEDWLHRCEHDPVFRKALKLG